MNGQNEGSETVRLQALAPLDLSIELKTILLHQRRTFTAWLIEQMEREVASTKGEYHGAKRSE